MNKDYLKDKYGVNSPYPQETKDRNQRNVNLCCQQLAEEFLEIIGEQLWENEVNSAEDVIKIYRFCNKIITREFVRQGVRFNKNFSLVEKEEK